MRIYLAHPYTGDEERNRKLALDAEELLRKATPNAEFFNPVGRMTERFRGDVLRWHHGALPGRAHTMRRHRLLR